VGGSLKLDKSQIHFSISYGSEGIKRQKVSGRWPGGSQNSSYEMQPLTVKMNSSRDILTGFVSTTEDLYLREIHIHFKLKSRNKKQIHFTGTYPGSPGLTVSNNLELIRFKRNKTMRQYICFRSNPKRLTVKLIWNVNCFLPKGAILAMDPVLISERKHTMHPSLKSLERPSGITAPRTAWLAPEEGNRGIRCKALEENLIWMEKERLFFDLVRLDGLHPKVGDWETLHSDFRGKIGFLNRRIEHNGMIPAIGFNPFYAESGSELVRLHPDWLVKDLKGDSLLVRQRHQKKLYFLDYTQSSVQQYLGETLELFNRQWGFKAFHIFDLFSLLTPGYRYNNSIEPGTMIHQTLEIFRQVLGKSCFISAENSPLITQEKLLSMICIRTETGSRRKSRKLIPESINKILDHTFTSPYPWLMNMGSYPLPEVSDPLHPQAAESLRQMILISGGFLTIQRELTDLSGEQGRELEKLISSFKRFALGTLHILKTPDRKEPCIVYNSAGYIGVFNLSGKRQQISLDMENLKQTIYNKQGESLIREGKTGMRTGELELRLPPYGSRIFKF